MYDKKLALKDRDLKFRPSAATSNRVIDLPQTVITFGKLELIK